MGSFTFHIDERLVNTLLKRIPDQKLAYRHGCLVGAAKLPLGAVNAIVIPSYSGSHIVLAVPFKEIKGDITGKFFLSKLVSTFWGTISKQVEKMALPVLQKNGLGRDSLTIEKVKDRGGDVGKIKLSVKAINRWLERQHPGLSPRLTGITFSPGGVEVTGELQASNLN
jgi:hypothetical protein